MLSADVSEDKVDSSCPLTVNVKQLNSNLGPLVIPFRHRKTEDFFPPWAWLIVTQVYQDIIAALQLLDVVMGKKWKLKLSIVEASIH